MTQPIVEIIIKDTQHNGPASAIPSKKKKKVDKPEMSPEERADARKKQLMTNHMLSDCEVLAIKRKGKESTDLEWDRIVYKFSMDAHSIFMNKRASRAKLRG
jgi:hypothetical protein